MSILIKGMKMPEYCFDCRFHKSLYCTLTDICINTAQGWCPLIEIPPHGDLIDRWELTETAMIDPDEGKYVAVYRADEVDEAPVVIEAEE